MQYFASLVAAIFPLLLHLVSGSVVDIFERRMEKTKCKKKEFIKCFAWMGEKECACAKECKNKETWIHECEIKKNSPTCKCKECKKNQIRQCKVDNINNLKMCYCDCDDNAVQNCKTKKGKLKCKCKSCKKDNQVKKCTFGKTGDEICACEKPCKKKSEAMHCFAKKDQLKCECTNCKKPGKVIECFGKGPWGYCKCKCKEGWHEFCPKKKKECSCKKIPKCEGTYQAYCPTGAKTPGNCICYPTECLGGGKLVCDNLWGSIACYCTSTSPSPSPSLSPSPSSSLSPSPSPYW